VLVSSQASSHPPTLELSPDGILVRIVIPCKYNPSQPFSSINSIHGGDNYGWVAQIYSVWDCPSRYSYALGLALSCRRNRLGLGSRNKAIPEFSPPPHGAAYVVMDLPSTPPEELTARWDAVREVRDPADVALADHGLLHDRSRVNSTAGAIQERDSRWQSDGPPLPSDYLELCGVGGGASAGGGANSTYLAPVGGPAFVATVEWTEDATYRLVSNEDGALEVRESMVI
jgi:hypothetical protein